MGINTFFIGIKSNFFNPKLVPGLVLWFDFSDVRVITLRENYYVTQINDKSISGLNATQSNTSMQMQYITNAKNGLNVMRCSNVNQVYSYAGSALTKNIGYIAIFTVCSSANVATSSYLSTCDFATGSPILDRAKQYIRSSAVESAGRRLDSNSYQEVHTGSLSNNTYYTFLTILDYANANAYAGVNGTKVARSGGFQTAGNTSNTNSGYDPQIGGRSNLSVVGDYCEQTVFIRTTPLTDIEINRLYTYFRNKWALY